MLGPIWIKAGSGVVGHSAGLFPLIARADEPLPQAGCKADILEFA